jgi:ferredoxin-thioredoxin reductase catalytic chain
MTSRVISDQEVDTRYQKLDREAEESGYHLNPDVDFTKNLVRGLLINEERFGYPACPCRLSFGKRDEDRDIICPCDYRDPDLNEYGACYCALYVSEEKLTKKVPMSSIPERRPPRKERKAGVKQSDKVILPRMSYPVWRCRVCGYLCARETPPLICPICKATQDRFERFL